MTRSSAGRLRIPGFPKKRYDNYIGGKWSPPVDGEYFDNITPGDGAGDVPDCAVEGGRRGKGAGRGARRQGERGARRRRPNAARVLERIAQRIEDNLEMLATIETWDNGKPIRETMAADIPLAVDHFRYFAGVVRAQEGSIGEIDRDDGGVPLSRAAGRGGRRLFRGTSRS